MQVYSTVLHLQLKVHSSCVSTVQPPHPLRLTLGVVGNGYVRVYSRARHSRSTYSVKSRVLPASVCSSGHLVVLLVYQFVVSLNIPTAVYPGIYLIPDYLLLLAVG